MLLFYGVPNRRTHKIGNTFNLFCGTSIECDKPLSPLVSDVFIQLIVVGKIRWNSDIGQHINRPQLKTDISTTFLRLRCTSVVLSSRR